MTTRLQHALAPWGDGELTYCTVCGGAEGALPTLCPERKLTSDELDSIYASRLDFDTGPMAGAIWWSPTVDIENIRAIVERLVAAEVAHSWKGGGDPTDIPEIVAELAEARAEFESTLKEIV